MNQLSLLTQTVLDGVNNTGNTQGVYTHVSRKLGISKTEMEEVVYIGSSMKTSYWKRRIRFIQQNLKQLGLIDNAEDRGKWKVTTKGQQSLTFMHSKGMKIGFVTKSGIAFWGSAEHLPEMFKGEVDLIVTSPPYLLTNKRDYGDIGSDEKSYVENILKLAEGWMSMLTSTGSIVLNIGDSYKKGAGYQSLHKERLLIALEDKLGLHLIQKFTWWNPSKAPNGYWTTHAKRDLVQATEDFFWLSPNPKEANACNQRVKVEYSETQKKLIKQQMGRKGAVSLKPSGNSANPETFYSDNGGAIAHNILIASPEGANSKYSRHCKENNLPRHPAMFNYELPEFFIKFLTRPGQVVADPFFGSGNTGYAAEKNGRNWIGSDTVREYLCGAQFRFIH